MKVSIIFGGIIKMHQYAMIMKFYRLPFVVSSPMTLKRETELIEHF
jgi:hypothetical protein